MKWSLDSLHKHTWSCTVHIFSLHTQKIILIIISKNSKHTHARILIMPENHLSDSYHRLMASHISRFGCWHSWSMGLVVCPKLPTHFSLSGMIILLTHGCVAVCERVALYRYFVYICDWEDVETCKCARTFFFLPDACMLFFGRMFAQIGNWTLLPPIGIVWKQQDFPIYTLTRWQRQFPAHGTTPWLCSVVTVSMTMLLE